MTRPEIGMIKTPNQKYFCKRNISNLLRSHCVSLANDWDDVDLVVQLLHELNVKRLQT